MAKYTRQPRILDRQYRINYAALAAKWQKIAAHSAERARSQYEAGSSHLVAAEREQRIAARNYFVAMEYTRKAHDAARS